MSKYGQHFCLNNDTDIIIERASGDWWMSVPVEIENTQETQIEDYKIKYCPFCGEDLENG